MLHAIVLATIMPFLPPAVELDFSGVAAGLDYRIDVVVRDATGKVLVSGPIDIGNGADATDIRDLFAAALGDSGLEIITTGDHKLCLASKEDTRLGAITYDTLVKGLPANLVGPKLLSQIGGTSLSVNGKKR